MIFQCIILSISFDLFFFLIMTDFDLHSYDKYIVSFSGGKDSTATFLYLLENKIPKEKIELWHQDVDGREQTFFDWEVTVDYCKCIAKSFGVPIYFQWKTGGFYREMMRENSLTAPVCFECDDGVIGMAGGTRGKLDTRRRFPQAAASLTTRWCSSYLKIDVCSIAIINQPRFRNCRTLVLAGERGEESANRAKYAVFEPDRTDLRNGKNYYRHVDRLRPLLRWTESEVWALLEKYRIKAHPCYYLGWGRCSCKFCVFGNKDQFASVAKISPKQTQLIIQLEKEFDCTINRKKDLPSLITSGTPYRSITDELVVLATNHCYDQEIFFTSNQKWELPPGAFGDSCGAI